MKTITNVQLSVYGNGRMLVAAAAVAVKKNMHFCSVQKPEETKKVMGSPMDCATPAVRRIACSDEGN